MVYIAGLIDIPMWLLLLVAVAILLYVYGTFPFRTWRELEIKGPKPLPFMGNVTEMFDDRIGTRAAIKKWTAEFGRIFGLYYFRTPSLVVTDPDALKQVYVKEFNNFTDRFFAGNGNMQQRIIKKGIFFEDGADWKRIRRIMSPTFSSGKIKLLTPYINLTAQRLGENLRQMAKEGKMAEAKKVFGAFSLDVICGTAFGLDTNSQQDFEAPFIKNAKGLMTFDKSLQLILAVTCCFPVVGKLAKAMKLGFFKNRHVKFFEENISALIQQRKENPNLQKETDFLQLLMNAEADPSEGFVGERKLTTEEIAAQGIIFIIAGYETTSTTLQYLAYEFAQNPEIQEKVVAEMREVLGDHIEPNYDNCQKLKYMEAAINETLRLYPPVHVLTRNAENATVLNGVPCPAGTSILIPIGNIGRDPQFFPDPDTFKPERFMETAKQDFSSVTFTPFGFGPRQCIGMRLAMMELKIAIVSVLRNVKIIGATPDVLDIEDYTGVLIPRVPIKLQMEAVN